jgi:hypothetical protein
MIHRCTIERNTVASLVDDYKNPVPPQFEALYTDVPCRGWLYIGRTADDGKTVVVEDRRILVPLGTDVTERDHISSITDRLGAELFTGPMRIDHVGVRKDHLVLSVTEVA